MPTYLLPRTTHAKQTTATIIRTKAPPPEAATIYVKGRLPDENRNDNKNNYYMANPVLGKSLRSDWFFLGQDFAVRTVSMETVQPVYFCFGAKPANSKFATKTAKKNYEYCHSSQ